MCPWNKTGKASTANSLQMWTLLCWHTLALLHSLVHLHNVHSLEGKDFFKDFYSLQWLRVLRVWSLIKISRVERTQGYICKPGHNILSFNVEPKISGSVWGGWGGGSWNIRFSVVRQSGLCHWQSSFRGSGGKKSNHSRFKMRVLKGWAKDIISAHHLVHDMQCFGVLQYERNSRDPPGLEEFLKNTKEFRAALC